MEASVFQVFIGLTILLIPFLSFFERVNKDGNNQESMILQVLRELGRELKEMLDNMMKKIDRMSSELDRQGEQKQGIIEKMDEINTKMDRYIELMEERQAVIVELIQSIEKAAQSSCGITKLDGVGLMFFEDRQVWIDMVAKLSGVDVELVGKAGAGAKVE